ncbi:RAB6A [Mytilus edulis]|uniref:RAB6A n=1 Tax=Mytilus edulis TaxID=6550 RepID=A0A8S3SQY8_MYTED|nr:RAB6A [Mytilus edulis]
MSPISRADKVRIPNFKVGNDTVSLLIFDTGGHHIQRGIIHKFIDAADKLQDVNENSAIGSSPEDDDPLLMIIGNKTDLSATDVRWSSETSDNDEPKEIKRSVKENQLRKTAAANNISMYKEVSAKADINIDLTFKSVVEKLIELRGTSKALKGNMKESKPWHKFCDIL